MATIVLTDAQITINSVDLSTRITKVTIKADVDDVDNTAFGGGGWKSRQGGLKEGTIDLEFNQDWAAANVDATIWPLLGTLTTVVVKPTSGAVSATNPSYTASCLVKEFAPIDGSVGDLAKTSVSWPVSGAVARATT